MLKFHSLPVVQVQPEAEDALGIALAVPAELEQQFRASPGQHIVLRAMIDGEETRRTYSLINAPQERPLRILARMQPGGRMSGFLSRLHAGETLEVLPPNGSFTPHAGTLGAGIRVAFAAGSGITPVLSVARSVLAAGGRMIVFYGNRSAARTMGLEELEGLKDRYPDRLSLHFLMSREPQEVELYNGRLDADKVRELSAAFCAPQAVAEYFICGPGQMAETVAGALAQLGVPAERIRIEHFTAVVPGETAARPAGAQAKREAAGLAQVTLTLDGRRRSFTMRLEEETVLDAAERAGLDLPFSCRSGVCSTCRTKVVRGEVEMLQNYALEDWEVAQGYVLACQSRCKTAELELDYDEK
jgi:ring-1,2-phenylacetyl-CoA epoxidase subunit PaaE